MGPASRPDQKPEREAQDDRTAPGRKHFRLYQQQLLPLYRRGEKVADYVLSHKTGVQYMSISELAEECGVAEATVSRFCRRLKLKGYNAFKLTLAKAIAQEQGTTPIPVMEGQEEDIGPEDSISDLCRKLYTAHTTAIAQSMALIRADTITRAAELLWNADKVYCMGQGGSMILAHEAAHLFSTVSNHFFFVQDSHIQASTAAPC